MEPLQLVLDGLNDGHRIRLLIRQGFSPEREFRNSDLLPRGGALGPAGFGGVQLFSLVADAEAKVS